MYCSVTDAWGESFKELYQSEFRLPREHFESINTPETEIPFVEETPEPNCNDYIDYILNSPECRMKLLKKLVLKIPDLINDGVRSLMGKNTDVVMFLILILLVLIFARSLINK
jgi:hypothetical protein